MKVDLLITELNTGGAERCCAALALHLTHHQHRVRVFSIGPRPRTPYDALIRQLDDAGIESHCFGAKHLWDLPRVRARLRAAVRQQPPDVAQSFLWHANMLSASIYPAFKIPWVAGVRVVEPRRWRAWLAPYWSRRATRVVCVSSEVAEWCVLTEGVPAERLMVIPNGVEIPDACRANPWILEPDARPLKPAPTSASQLGVLLFVGRLEPQKGVDALLLHADAILEQLPTHRLVFIGDGSMREDCAAYQRRSPHAARIELLGQRDDVADWMQRAELLLLPTRYEGMPNVVLEAMASGLPVCVTRVEGIGQLLGDTLELQSVPREDWVAWAERVVQLIRDPKLMHRLALANRHRASQAFERESLLNQYEMLHQSLVIKAR